MGCTISVYAIGKTKTKKKKIIPEVSMFVPFLRVPMQSDNLKALRGLLPKDLADRINSLRNQIVFIAENTGGSAISELIKALEEYSSLVIGLTKKEYEFQDLVEFRWRELDDGKQEIRTANTWLELISVLHMMAVLMLMDANLKLIPKDNSMCERLVSPDCMRDAVHILVKAAGYLNLCIQDVLLRLPPDVKDKLPSNMQRSVLEAISHQALGQGTEIQLGLAVQSQNASLPVKRRLACEQLSFFSQAYSCLSEADNAVAGKKQLLYLKWKHLEAKAAAYYYHGHILDKGTEPACHVSAVCCFLASEELLTESKKACLTFCLAHPITRASPPWGAMKQLHKKIPEMASKKSQMYGYLLDQEKGLQNLPDLPEFELSLKPDDYELPGLDPAWDIPVNSLKEHVDDI
ncbi:hypothetical protein CASFOL_023856 [Castilleja foliolosa]|uniref:BRO1 domain-containing protein n=1 Tax=Castilleja foliolosa TaxID=1961234 RepID=A0ABD3CQK9_9LAMI